MEGKTPVTILQEWFSKQKKTPTYNLIHNGSGTHDPLFTYEVSGAGLTATGSGKSKKEAKHEAARAFLEIMKKDHTISDSLIDETHVSRLVVDQIDASIETPFSPYTGNLKDNAVGELNEFCSVNDLKTPTYKLTRDEGLPHAKIFAVRCEVSSFSTEATERTKKQAKHRAAHDMLQKLKSCMEQLSKTAGKEKAKVTTEDAIEICIERKVLGAPKSKLNLKDYYTALKGVNSQSPTLDSIKRLDTDWLRRVPNVTEVFDNVMKELAIEFTEKALRANPKFLEKHGGPLFINALMVQSSPEWTFIGKGATPKIAAENAKVECLNFFIELS